MAADPHIIRLGYHMLNCGRVCREGCFASEAVFHQEGGSAGLLLGHRRLYKHGHLNCRRREGVGMPGFLTSAVCGSALSASFGASRHYWCGGGGW